MKPYIDSYLQEFDSIKIVRDEEGGDFDVLGRDSHISLDYDPADTKGIKFSVPYSTEYQPLPEHTITGLLSLN